MVDSAARMADTAAASDSATPTTGDDGGGGHTHARRGRWFPPPGTMAPGTMVVIAGLTSQPDLNGRWGAVRKFNRVKGRYEVELSTTGDCCPPPRLVALKPTNVFIEAAAAVDPGTCGEMAIDISPFECDVAHASAGRRTAAASWDAIFREVGFARIVGHGVPDSLVAELRTAAKVFFARPESEKIAYHRPTTSLGVQSGSYSPIWYGRDDGSTDIVEGYTFMRPHDGWNLTRVKLEHPPELADVAGRYCREVERVMHSLHRLSAAALGLAPNFFETAAGTNPSSLLVISNYPPLSDPHIGSRREDQPRYRAHSDYTGKPGGVYPSSPCAHTNMHMVLPAACRQGSQSCSKMRPTTTE